MSQEVKSCLLQLSIGPVQEFIAAARRTRDLWFGSFMLSEISKAAAKALKDAKAELIFPEPDGDLNPKSELNVANVILARVHGGHAEMRALSDKTRTAAVERFKAFADEAYKKAERCIVKERWDKQIEDVIEFYAAWTEIGTGEGAYKAARQRVARLLAARKNLRDFLPYEGEFGVPKSSLDGLRESVFRDGKVPAIAGLRLKEGEALDSVGLIKRVAGDERFPSVSRVAVDPWVRGAREETLRVETLRELTPHCEALVKAGAISRVRGGEAFPYEGTAVLLSRHASMLAECGDKEGANAACKAIAEILSRLRPQDRPLEPYFALLVADGDRMGAAISEIGDMERHQKFSSTLSKFAGKAREIVQEHSGVCVYTGGDDVLAFLPLDTCLPCARELHDAFGELLKDYKSIKDQRAPTLSVGISIGHAMEDLEDLLAFGREAEKVAKKGVGEGSLKAKTDRNGLAVVVRSRGSGAVVVREQWGDRAEETRALAKVSLDERLHYWARLFADGAIPNKFPYELRENVEFYRGWEAGDVLKAAMQDDIKRIFRRKDVNLSDKERNRVETYIDAALCGSCQIDRLQNELVISRGDARDIDRLSDELLIAQWIGFGVRQAKGGDR
ncbi:type III-B CRISPR-associated protein Cas10/Cmr2 [Fretibacterium sp. OH1220_COT-178]|uniref:type III-B CRISPR-associated protein Cas10/Cmr2 n=1 Tax=Fretibacterium sp. OH1220_COT-178 TaxID=2491047 RepID=UPI000F5F2B0B|nr:type III-B CRISPR-associated protein Cas10/Cmr2 [Fretibacterium sp. OH1220_COT-178]RRD64215.1 type III-B CRISPR-associated protein Cas10/Cmr2 [Fretibacterium sp. OH1220_COT-178]